MEEHMDVDEGSFRLIVPDLILWYDILKYPSILWVATGVLNFGHDIVDDVD
jgi:hypothetical protein